MELRPISVRDAKAQVTMWHRHLRAPQGARFALAAWKDGKLVGVAMVGNPVARMTATADPFCAEIIRVATDGTRNAPSFLYTKAKRAAQALGFRRVITKTLPEESGASLRAIGATRRDGASKGGSWNRRSRPRTDKHPTQPKIAWEL
jgi:hypothetical protein